MEGSTTTTFSCSTYEEKDNLIVPLANLIKDEIRNELKNLNLVEKSELKTFIKDIQKFQKIEIPRSISEVVKNDSSPSTYADLSDLVDDVNYTYVSSQKMTTDETDQGTDTYSNDEKFTTLEETLSRTSIISLKESKELMKRFESLETKVNKMIEILEPLTEMSQGSSDSIEIKRRKSECLAKMKQIVNVYDEMYYLDRQRKLNLTTYKKSERTLNFNKRPTNTQFAIMPPKSHLLKRLSESEKLQMGCHSVFLSHNPKMSIKRLLKNKT